MGVQRLADKAFQKYSEWSKRHFVLEYDIFEGNVTRVVREGDQVLTDPPAQDANTSGPGVTFGQERSDQLVLQSTVLLHFLGFNGPPSIVLKLYQIDRPPIVSTNRL
jgi:hypothetical protein